MKATTYTSVRKKIAQIIADICLQSSANIFADLHMDSFNSHGNSLSW